jgi:hypothetical protein
MNKNCALRNKLSLLDGLQPIIFIKSAAWPKTHPTKLESHSPPTQRLVRRAGEHRGHRDFFT